MTEVVKQLNEAERARMSAQAQGIAQAVAPKLAIGRGEQFVFVAHFDGTNNDKDNLALSGNPQPTNVAELYEQMKPHETGNPNFRTVYYPGVGTDPGAKGYHDVLRPTDDMQDTAQKAYDKFQDQATAWLRGHPQANPTESLQVMATGFSRGGGTAAVFSQLLYERGLSDPNTGKMLVPPGQLGLAGAMILDPVTTGYEGNTAFSPASKNVTVVRAQNEYRTWFKGVDHSHHPGVNTVDVTGNHCNIGGGYDRGIGAHVLEASTEWFKKTGVPINDVPAAKRPDGSATVYHERDIPKTDEAIQISRHPAMRTLLPNASRIAEVAAQGADYPVTHDPRQGLHAPRQLDPSAHPERQRADGWSRFNGAHGAVWRKDYTSDKGVPLSAVVVERDPPGTQNDRVDMVLMRRDGQGQLLMDKRLPAGSGAALRDSLDQRLDPPNIQVAPGRHGPSAEQHSQAQHFKDQLGPRLAQLGMNEQQIDTLSAAAVKEQTRYAAQGQAQAFYLSNDGNTIAMRQEHAPLHEFSVEQALGQSAQAHWREAIALSRHETDQPIQMANASIQKEPSAPIRA